CGSTNPCNSAHGTTCSISSRNRSRFVFRPYFSKPVCAAKVCCRIRLFTSTYTVYAQPVDRRVLQRFPSARRGNRLNPFSQFTNSMEIHTDDGRGSPVSPSCKFGIQASELCDSFARPTQLPGFATQLTPLTVVRDKFTNKAG